jgi:titin
MKHRAITLIFCFAAIASLKTNATTYTVTNTLDAGTGSLRQAITSANSNMMGPNDIVFNIPNTDPNFNATTGVYTITLASLLPTINCLSCTIDGTTQPGSSNPYGPEICIKSTTNLYYALCYPFSGGVAKGLIINGFQNAIVFTTYLTYPSGSCSISDCYIGVNYNGSAIIPNGNGVVLYGGVANNTITNNLISGNTTAGILVQKSNGNVIQGNKIGCDRTGIFAIPNYYGIAIDSSANNTIGGSTSAESNIISGNAYAGIGINSNMSFNNSIKGNYIGININGAIRTDTIPNYYGIAILDSYNNTIGGSTAGERNIISGNPGGGINISGSNAINNTIQGNYIGTNVAGTDSIPNSNGILISGVSNNIIGGSSSGEGNLISGNTAAGIVMVYIGTRLNKVIGNYIGTDYQGTHILSNYAGIYIKSNANYNTVGGSVAGDRNIISGNIGMGVCIESADSNVVQGNYIGPDVTGLNALRLSNDTLVQENGLYFNAYAKYNIAGGYNAGEGNLISGNRMYGHTLYGNASYNYTIGNYIGVDATGNHAMPNATGICVDGSANHNPIINNVLSGNHSYGLFIVTTGSDYNVLKGNKIGTNAAGTDSVPNKSGLLIGGGTKYDTIGGISVSDRNIISGNKFDGIEIADLYTSNCNIEGNYIGTDISGTLALPNSIGIGLSTNPSKINIENNVISGNSYVGLILYEQSDSNTVYSNKIGVASNGTTALKNKMAGIVIAKTSKYNKIGAPNKGNIIAYNDSIGIAVGDYVDTETVFNTISANQIYNNGIMDIDIYPVGVNTNDVGDTDKGCNEQMNYPVIQSVFLDYHGIATITGTMDCTTYGGPAGIRIELFKSNGANTYNHGGATAYLGDTIIVNSSGNWSFHCTGLSGSDMVTATATDIHGNTSEFAENSGITVGVKEITSNKGFSVYPNPASSEIEVSIGQEAVSSIEIYNLLGEMIYTTSNVKQQTTNEIDISSFPVGAYFIEIKTEKGYEIKKFVKE